VTLSYLALKNHSPQQLGGFFGEVGDDEVCAGAADAY